MKNPRFITNQAGIGTVVIVLIVAVVLAGVGGAVWFGLRARGIKVPFVPAQYSLNDKCEHNDPELCKFLNNFSTIKNYTVKSTTTAAGSTSESTYVLDGEERFQIINSTGGKEDLNMISIGNTTYTKDYSDGKWFKQTAEPAQQQEHKQEFEFDDAHEGTAPEHKTTYKFVAKEKCDSRNCFKYQVMTAGSEGSEFIWFDDQEYRLRKSRSEAGGVVSELSYSYDKTKISEPSPVKEGTPAPSLPATPTPSPSGDSGAADMNMYEVPADSEY